MALLTVLPQELLFLNAVLSQMTGQPHNKVLSKLNQAVQAHFSVFKVRVLAKMASKLSQTSLHCVYVYVHMNLRAFHWE